MKNKEQMKVLAKEQRANSFSQVAGAWIGRLPNVAFYPGLVLGCAAAIMALYLLGVAV